MNYAVVMAGGTGKRLWPLSREKRPKQILKLFEGQTLLYRCIQRLLPVFDPRNILILTNAGYVDLVRENLPDIPFDNVIPEPVVRDTAGAIALAATILAKFDADATMAVLTADQIIEPAHALQNALKDAIAFTNENPDSMLVFGIQPHFPATQLGYIKLGPARKCDNATNKVYPVLEFKEKPDTQTAEQYVQSGQYLWNAGLFVFKIRTILANIEKFLPDAAEPLRVIRANWDGPNQYKTLADWFPKLPKISIDFAVMEKAPNIYAIKLDCRWLDLGSFAALADVISSDKNNNIIVAGASELLDSKNNIIITEDGKHLIAVIGLEGMVVAHSPDATLVCPIDQTDRLKQLLELIKLHTGEKFL